MQCIRHSYLSTNPSASSSSSNPQIPHRIHRLIAQRDALLDRVQLLHTRARLEHARHLFDALSDARVQLPRVLRVRLDHGYRGALAHRGAHGLETLIGRAVQCIQREFQSVRRVAVRLPRGVGLGAQRLLAGRASLLGLLERVMQIVLRGQRGAHVRVELGGARVGACEAVDEVAVRVRVRLAEVCAPLVDLVDSRSGGMEHM
jgi:hypothetical protein